MKSENLIFSNNDDLYSSSSEYMSSSSSVISNKLDSVNKSNEFPKLSIQHPINENDYFSEDQFNQMQDEILKSGQKLEPIIQAYVQNHKKSSAFLPINSLFDLFKRELKMNLIIRQNLMKERSAKQEILNNLHQLEAQKNDFFQIVSQKINQNISNYEEITNFITQQLDSFKDNSKIEKKTFLNQMKTLKEENERLIQQNSTIKNTLNDKETEKSIEVSQLLSTIQNSKHQIQNFELQFKNQSFQINQLKDKIEKKKQKINYLKDSISKLNSSNEAKIKVLNENLLKYETIINDLNLQKEQLIKENEEQVQNQIKSQNEIEQLKSKIKKMDSVEQKNKELNKKLNENDELIQKFQDEEVLYEKAKKRIIKLRKKINQFRNLLKDLSEQLSQKTDDIEKANQTISKLNSKIDKLQNIHSIEIDLVKTQHLEQSKQTNDQLILLENKFHLIQKNYSFCNDENKRLQYQLKQASKDINRLESENAKLLVKLEKISIMNENQEEIKDYQENN